jgi:hypothetical protein
MSPARRFAALAAVTLALPAAAGAQTTTPTSPAETAPAATTPARTPTTTTTTPARTTTTPTEAQEVDALVDDVLGPDTTTTAGAGATRTTTTAAAGAGAPATASGRGAAAIPSRSVTTPAELAFTGADPALVIGLGAALLAVSSLVLLVRRRRAEQL